MHKGEILRLERMVNEKGLSIVPTKIYIDKGRVKIEIGLAKGKKLYDKRAVLRDRAIARDIDKLSKICNPFRGRKCFDGETEVKV